MLILGSVGDGGSASSSSSSSSDEASEESADPVGPPVPSAAGGKVVTLAKGQKKGSGGWGSQGLNIDDMEMIWRWSNKNHVVHIVPGKSFKSDTSPENKQWKLKITLFQGNVIFQTWKPGC